MDPTAAPAPPPLDPTYQSLSHQQTQAVAEVARAVMSAEGVRWLKAQVTATHTEDLRRFVVVRRPDQDTADVKPYPVLHSGVMPAVGDWVNALETPGGLIIMGVEQRTDATTLAGLKAGTQLNDDSVTGRIVAYRTLGNSHHSDSSVDGRVISPASIDNDELGALAATNSKINDMDGGKLHAGSVTDGRLASNYSLVGHTHSYASSTHNHDGTYVNDTGDTVAGNLRITGQTQAESLYVYFGGWLLCRRDAQGYLWA